MTATAAAAVVAAAVPAALLCAGGVIQDGNGSPRAHGQPTARFEDDRHRTEMIFYMCVYENGLQAVVAAFLS